MRIFETFSISSDMVEELSDLENKLFDNSFGPMTLKREIEAGQGWAIGSPIIAYVLTREDNDLVDITRLGVSPDVQGQGFGRKLLRLAIQTDGDVILTVRKTNLKAFKLYHDHAFRIVGELKGDPGSWLMRLHRN